MEYRLLRHNGSGEIVAVREDGQATGPLRDNDFRDADMPDATIRVDWADGQRYSSARPELWDNNDYTVLATDRDPLGAVVDKPESLDGEDEMARHVEGGDGPHPAAAAAPIS
jgi:hypothetical protein